MKPGDKVVCVVPEGKYEYTDTRPKVAEGMLYTIRKVNPDFVWLMEYPIHCGFFKHRFRLATEDDL